MKIFDAVATRQALPFDTLIDALARMTTRAPAAAPVVSGRRLCRASKFSPVSR